MLEYSHKFRIQMCMCEFGYKVCIKSPQGVYMNFTSEQVMDFLHDTFLLRHANLYQ